MAVVALDTHAVVKELQAAGFSEAQAEAVTRAVHKGQEVDLSHLATKTDLQGLRGEVYSFRTETKSEFRTLRAEFEALRASTKADIDSLRAGTKAEIDNLRVGTKADMAEMKADLLKWMVGAIGVQTIAILGAIVGLTRILKG